MLYSDLNRKAKVEAVRCFFERIPYADEYLVAFDSTKDALDTFADGEPWTFSADGHLWYLDELWTFDDIPEMALADFAKGIHNAIECGHIGKESNTHDLLISMDEESWAFTKNGDIVEL